MAQLYDYHENWIRLVDKAIRDGYQSLSTTERVWFNAQSFLQAIYDGGLISYYYNSSADTLADCLVDLRALGAHAMERLLDQVNGLFPGGVPGNIGDRNEVINSWTDDGSVDKFLDPIEEEATSEARRLETRLTAFIEEQGLGT